MRQTNAQTEDMPQLLGHVGLSLGVHPKEMKPSFISLPRQVFGKKHF
jgi:hypothetical protein